MVEQSSPSSFLPGAMPQPPSRTPWLVGSILEKHRTCPGLGGMVRDNTWFWLTALM
jgi:hypothetical protein